MKESRGTTSKKKKKKMQTNFVTSESKFDIRKSILLLSSYNINKKK